MARDVSGPAFLLLELASEHADQEGVLAGAAALARRAGGDVHAFAAPGRSTCLEPGTVASGILFARWNSRATATAFATNTLLPHLAERLPRATAPLLLIIDSLPDAGLPDMPDIPTAASVPRPPQSPRNCFLVVRGTAWDSARLERYRDVILPMHKERGGFYECFAVAPGQVEAVSGVWTEQIFAISRWPTRAAAEDFWFSGRYQTEAIPLRLGAGRFVVHALDASD